MKHALVCQATAAGAGSNAGTFISDNGKVISKTSYTVQRKTALTRISIMGANSLYLTLSRSGHPGEDLVLPAIADTLADQFKVIDLLKILGGKGVVIDANESISLTVQAGGAATSNIYMELDDQVPSVNVKAIRAAGANAAVASTPVETGANITANLQPNKQYRMRGLYVTSTTIHAVSLGLSAGLCVMPGKNALVTGQEVYKLTDDQVKALTGSGSDYTQTFEAWITATGTDAAAVQIFYVIWETN